MAYNASKQKSPVVYYLWDSPFQVVHRDYKYFFSTVKHAEKFEREVIKREEWLCDSLSRRFNVPIRCELLADVQWYQMVEGRGFAIQSSDGIVFESPQEFLVYTRVDYNG